MADQKALMMKMGIEGSNKVQRELKQTGAAAKKMGRGLNAANASAKRLAASLSPAVLGLSAVTAGLAGVAGFRAPPAEADTRHRGHRRGRSGPCQLMPEHSPVCVRCM